MKKLFLLLVVFLLSVSPSMRAEVKNGTSGQCTWTFDTVTGVLTITAGSDGGAMADYQYVDTESVLDSYVNSPWWADRMNIKQVVIEEGVTYIGELAFNNCRLTDIVVPNSVTKVGAQAFLLSTAKTITIGNGVTDIGHDAFYCLPYTPDGTYTKQTVTLGTGVKNVGSAAFSYPSIQHFTLMGPAFESWEEAPDVSRLDETTIHVTFENYNGWIEKYPAYKPIMDWYADGAGSKQWTSGSCTVKLNLDYSLTISGSGAMENYTSVEDCPWKEVIGNINAVTVEEGVTSLSTNGFVGADNVTDVYLKCDPFTTATWADYANAFNPATVYTCEKEGWFVNFSDMGGQFLTRCGDGVAWNYKNKVLTFSKYADGTGVMNNYSSYEDGRAPWDNLLMTDMEIINIEDGVTTIGNYAFNACNATEISMPASVTTIGRGAFRFAHIKRFEMPATMTEVPADLFYGSSIEEVVLPEGLTTISPQAFLQCTSLKQIYLPKTLNSIGSDAFKDVTSAVDVYAYSILNPSNVEWPTSETDFNSNTKVHVPTGFGSAWQNRFPTAKVQWVDDAYGEDAPMELASTADWRTFRNHVVSGATSIHAKMTADITISDADGYVGNSNKPYGGVFDGNGHKLTLNYGERGEGNGSRAPFNSIRGATIKNVHFTGKHENYQYFSIFGGNYYKGSWFCAGVVANVFGSGNFIENCRISTNFCYAGFYNAGVAAIVNQGATLTIANVLYDGKFVYGHESYKAYDAPVTLFPPTNNSVFVSRNFGTVKLENSYVNAAELRTFNSPNSSRYPSYLWTYNDGGTTTLNNCYYKNPGAYILDTRAVDAATLTTEALDRRMGAMWQKDGDNFIPLWLYPMEGAGTEDSPYQIGTDEDWRRFIHYTTLRADQYKGKHWQQTADIAGVTKWGAQLLGSDTAPAVYDGNGKTLTVDYASDVNFVAPIALMQKATIKGAIVKGSIVGGLHTAGLVSEVQGEGNAITNSLVDAHISFGTYNPHAGGFVGHAHTSQLTINGCKFTGRMEATTESENSVAGAILGWADNVGNISVVDCVERGEYGSSIQYLSMNAYILNGQVWDFGSNCLSFNNFVGGFYPYPVTWDTEKLTLTMGEPIVDYPVAGIKKYYPTTLYVFDDYYVGENLTFTFKLKTVDGYPVGNVKANDTLLEADADGNYSFTVKEPTTITADLANIVLKNDEDNSTVLAKYNGVKCDVTLQGRTLYKNDNWNTICLPFDVEGFGLDSQGEALLGFTKLIELDTERSWFDSTTGTLTLIFKDAGTSVKAGVPYLIKWNSGGQIDSPTFKDVIIKSGTPEGATTSDGYATFQGTYAPIGLTAADNDKLYVASDNKLYYPNGDMTVGAFRAYFQLNKGLTAGELPTMAIDFVFDTESTGISSVVSKEGTDTWYTVDGRRLQSRPTQKGIYITNGKKVYIK